jgi:hypothetical protein
MCEIYLLDMNPRYAPWEMMTEEDDPHANYVLLQQSPQNSTTRFSSSDAAETSRHGKLQVLSAEGTEHSSSKVCVS